MADTPRTRPLPASPNVAMVEGELPAVRVGFVAVDTGASPLSNASNLNFVQGQTVSSAVITPLTTG